MFAAQGRKRSSLVIHFGCTILGDNHKSDRNHESRLETLDFATGLDQVLPVIRELLLEASSGFENVAKDFYILWLHLHDSTCSTHILFCLDQEIDLGRCYMILHYVDLTHIIGI